MLTGILTVVATALLSSLFTLALAWLWFQRRAKRRLEARVAELEAELGELIRERVRQGVLDGVAAIPSAEVLRGTGSTVVETAGGLVREGLSTILGEPRERK